MPPPLVILLALAVGVVAGWFLRVCLAADYRPRCRAAEAERDRLQAAVDQLEWELDRRRCEAMHLKDQLAGARECRRMTPERMAEMWAGEN